MKPPVYVTGLGVVSPAGCGAANYWHALAGGQRFIETVADPRITGGGVACAGRVRGFEPPAGTATQDRVCQLAAAAADQAWAAAGLDGDAAAPPDRSRIAVSFGTSKGGILSFDRVATLLRGQAGGAAPSTSESFLQDPSSTEEIYLFEEVYSPCKQSYRGYKKYLSNTLEPTQNLLSLLSDVLPDAPARRLAARFGIAGGAHASVAACATGTLAIIRGAQMLLDGQADVVISGAADASLHPLWFAAFARMGVLAAAHPAHGAAWACRPFDAGRNGFAVSEGAAVLVLESAESVRKRGVEPLARISGFATGTDPAGLTQLNPDGAPLARIAGNACLQAGIAGTDLAAVQVHGTGTRANDLAEINALRTLCGDRLTDIPAVSFKGALGHMLGAAGAVELAAASMAVKQRRLPPNATLLDVDPAFADTWLPREPVELRPGPILKTSMGFGGHVAAVVLDAP